MALTIRWCGPIVASLLLTAPASAAGFALEHQNAAALGAAFAGAEAGFRDAGFAAYNPAAAAGLDRLEINLNVTAIWPDAAYEEAAALLLGSAPVAGTARSDGVIDDAIVPNLTIAAPVSDRLTLGVIANGTFGFVTDYADDSVIRYQARRSDLRVLEITPFAALRVSEDVSLGAALRFQSLDLSLTSTIDAGGVAAASLVPGFAPGSSDLDARFDGADWAVGFAIGVNAELLDGVRLGAFYASKIDHEFAGDAQFDIAASPAAQVLNGAAGLFAADAFSTALSTPASTGLGLRFAASGRWTILASARMTFWSEFEQVTLDFNDAATPSETLTQDWKDSFTASLGAEFEAGARTTLRAGVMIDESPVNAAYASPRIPDSDRHWIAVGASRALGDRLLADFGFAYALFSDRTIAIGGAAPEDLFRGALAAGFATDAFAASLRLRYRF